MSISKLMDKKKKCVIYTMQYYSVLKRKEVLMHTTKKINLKDIILSEMSQSQKTNTI